MMAANAAVELQITYVVNLTRRTGAARQERCSLVVADCRDLETKSGARLQ
jgi:hypothetical protein